MQQASPKAIAADGSWDTWVKLDDLDEVKLDTDSIQLQKHRNSAA